MKRAYYYGEIKDYLKDDNTNVFGELCKFHEHDLNDLQKNAWEKQIEITKNSFKYYPNGFIFFEFSIPRMGKRVDNIVIIDDLIFVIEFKVGSDHYDKSSIEQVIDYSFDLKNFHEGSHDKKIIPVLVATKAEAVKNTIELMKDDVYKPLLSNKKNLSTTIEEALILRDKTKPIDVIAWKDSIYKPTPTIIEAALALYNGHNVHDISRSDSGAINLSITTECLNKIINNAKTKHEKTICFLTGVPGAGKTLAGLNIATAIMGAPEERFSVFLSGNGPLVEVLREALARDQVITSKLNGSSIAKKDAKRKANSFIQNIHNFRDDGLESIEAPVEKVVVFDEAQRAWTKEQASSFMKRKKGIDNFDKSEPDFLIEVMNRHEDWCVIICLIGGGQEINTGEAGLEEWFNSLKLNFPKWKIHFSELIIANDNYLKNSKIIKFAKDNGFAEKELHLSVSLRSFRTELLSNFIEQLLRKNKSEAKKIYSGLSEKYPIMITRDLKEAKDFIRKNAVGSDRYGIIASSNARRLRPSGLDVKNKISPSNWFLNGKEDIRSSSFLEEVATEFDIQGLELDWSIIAWGGDLYMLDTEWQFQTFKGTKWQKINKDIIKQYLLNTYRVLLTRARQGMIIFIPNGDSEDKTRENIYYDGTFNYLKEIGIIEIL